MSIKGLFQFDNWDFSSDTILTALPAEDLALLTANQKEQRYKKGEIVFREGHLPSGIYYIKEGKIKKYKEDKDGKEHIIYVANSGELIGYHAILAGDRFPDSAASLEESHLIFIPKEDFILALSHSAILNSRLLKTLSHEFTVLTNSLSMLAQRSVRERLATQLIILREKYKVNFQPGMPVEIRMSREDLANLVGTARENVVRILSEFKEEKIVATKGRSIIVLDINKLLKLTKS